MAEEEAVKAAETLQARGKVPAHADASRQVLQKEGEAAALRQGKRTTWAEGMAEAVEESPARKTYHGMQIAPLQRRR